MAKFGEIAITNLTIGKHNGEEVFRYTSPTLKFNVQFERETTIINDWYWTKLQLKATIWDINNNIIYQDSSWKDLGSNYRYEGDTALAIFDAKISSFNPIKKIKLQGKRQNGDDVVEKTYTIGSAAIHSSITFNDNNNLVFNEYSASKNNLNIRPSDTMTNITKPELFSTNSTYENNINNYYHAGYLKAIVGTVKYLGSYRTPKAELIVDGQTPIQLNKGENKLNITYSLKNPKIRYTLGDAIYEENFDNIENLSEFTKNEFNFDGIVIEKDVVKEISISKDENGAFNGYKVTQGDIIDGFLRLNKDLSVLPYDFDSTTDKELKLKEGNNSTTYAVGQNNTISLTAFRPYELSTFSATFSNDDEVAENWIKSWDDEENIRAIKKDYNYNFQIKAKNKFTNEEEYIIIPFNSNNVIFEQYGDPIVLDDAIECSIIYDNTTLNTSIINPYEKLDIKRNEHYIYLPFLKTTLSDAPQTITIVKEYSFEALLNESGSRDKIYFETIGEDLLSSYSYDDIVNNLKIEKYDEKNPSVKYTRFLDINFSLTIIHKEKIFANAKSLNQIRIGRVVPIEIASARISNGQLNYILKEYGGDKNEIKTANEFISSNSSLSRSGQEYLVLDLQDEEKKSVCQMIIAVNESQGIDLKKIREYFSEGTLKILNPEDFDKKFKEDPTLLNKIKYIEGTYNYSYYIKIEDGKPILDEHQFFTFETIVNNVSGNPTQGIRKNGIIINGAPKQPLKDAPNGGKYFIEINALNINDRIVIKFPGQTEAYCEGEIYCEDGKIKLKGFDISGNSSSGSKEEKINIVRRFGQNEDDYIIGKLKTTNTSTVCELFHNVAMDYPITETADILCAWVLFGASAFPLLVSTIEKDVTYWYGGTSVKTQSVPIEFLYDDKTYYVSGYPIEAPLTFGAMVDSKQLPVLNYITKKATYQSASNNYDEAMINAAIDLLDYYYNKI